MNCFITKNFTNNIFESQYLDMRFNIASSAFILLSSIFLSCTRDISLDVGERMVVVECVLSCDSVQTLKMFYSHAKDKNKVSEPISKADVILFDETKDESVGNFKYSENQWVLDYSAEPEHSYKLDIDIEGHVHISACQTMPKQVSVASGIGNGFRFSSSSDALIYGNEFYGTLFYTKTLSSKTWIYALAYDEKTGANHIVDEICSNCPNIDNFNLTGDTYVAQKIDFIKEHGILPWKICKYLEGYPMYKRYMRINDQFDSAKIESVNSNFIVSGSFYEYDNPDKEQPLGSKGGIVFNTVSDDYDRYLKEAIYYQQKMESDDMTVIYNRDNVFSNIKGGIGIFGAKTECKLNWTMKPNTLYKI